MANHSQTSTQLTISQSRCRQVMQILGITEICEKKLWDTGDYKILERKLQNHRLYGLFCRYWSETTWPELPDEVRQQLKQRARANVLSSLCNIGVLQQLAHDLGQEELPFLVLKGEPLGVELYDEPGIRHSGDVDIWVEEANLQEVHACLTTRGFSLKDDYFERCDRYRRLYRRFLPHFIYERSDGALVEVHWRLFTNNSLMPLSFSQAYTHRQTVNLKGSELPVLGRKHRFLYLAAHGGNHLFVRLFWLIDLALSWSSRKEDVDALFEEANRLKMERILCYALSLLESEFSFDYSNRVKVALNRHQKGLRNLIEVSREAFQSHTVLGSGERLEQAKPYTLLSLESQLSPRFRYKTEVLFRLSLNQNTFKFCPLPADLYFIYPLVRLPLWCLERLKGKRT